MLIRQVNSLTRRVYSSTSTNLGNEIQNAKPFSAVPTISVWKVMKENLPGGRYRGKSVKEIYLRIYEDYGEIFRIPAHFGRPEIVMSYNSEHFEKVFRAEGTWPVRIGMDTLEYYRRTKRPEIYGDLGSLIVSQGEKWFQMRTIANPILMQPKTIKKYTMQIDEIAKEFIEVMRKIKNEKSEMPGDFSDYVNTWSLESVTAVGLERRLNLFDEKIKDENGKRLIKAIRKFLELTPKYDFELSIWKYYHTKGFKELLDTHDKLTDIILSYINQSVEEMKVDSTSSDQEDSVLRKLLRVDKRIAFVVASDLMLAGVDTTSSGVLFILYLLAKNPEKQEELRQEVLKILPEKDSKLTPEVTKNMPYLRAVIKLTVSLNAREIQKDIVISGYHIPAKTNVMMQFLLDFINEKYYPQPEKFLPERWLRVQSNECPQSKDNNPFSFIPFGFGIRSCPGKRIAELEMETLIANIVRNFKLEWHYPDMKVKSTIINIPDSEMRFKLIDL